MTQDSKLAQAIEKGAFIVTAELLPHATAELTVIEKVFGVLKDGPIAVNVADNPHGPVLSSLVGSVALIRENIEPIYQLVTRDRNRIALQSDLLGAAYLGIRNVLCLSGYHQTLTTSFEAGNSFDIDSIQLIAAIKKMNEQGVLLDGNRIEGRFSMLIGAVANPYLAPLELNILRVTKKVAGGARFIQTQAVFDTERFQQWLEAAREEGITEKVAILAGVRPLESVGEAEKLRDTLTDLSIPEQVIERLKAAGDEKAQKKEGLAICREVIKKIRGMKGLRGIHILSGGKESVLPELMVATK
ncbi:MAG: methylenetetrahydrofolate reductase [Thermodesulfobacteriota bacterium]|jgi:methylenetetrahydrofolate reductase (NADPH)|nr:MAG: methylenetetrahydrofolate reductase [Thermodesulfobacteriota bacterium]